MNLIEVQKSLKNSAGGRHVTLIAVSKMQPIELIKEAYDLGQRDFGENYVQELVEKSQALKDCCPEIRWHFIGALQSNKINQLVKNVHGLVAIQTVDSLSKFEKIVKAFEGQEIDLFIQVHHKDLLIFCSFVLCSLISVVRRVSTVYPQKRI